jgi:hypothetical protein
MMGREDRAAATDGPTTREGPAMPPWFPYLMALSAYIAAAGVVWAFCVLLALLAPTRRLARRLAMSMLASFPGVFLFQVLASPLCVALLFLVAAVFWLLGPDSSLAERLIMPAIFSSMILFAAASLCGFYAGWSVAWRVSGGADLGSTHRTHPLVGEIGSLPGRVSRQLRYIWRTSND